MKLKKILLKRMTLVSDLLVPACPCLPRRNLSAIRVRHRKYLLR